MPDHPYIEPTQAECDAETDRELDAYYARVAARLIELSECRPGQSWAELVDLAFATTEIGIAAVDATLDPSRVEIGTVIRIVRAAVATGLVR